METEIEERVENFAKFRSGEIDLIITKNLYSRGIDIPEVKLVINFDVPVMKSG